MSQFAFRGKRLVRTRRGSIINAVLIALFFICGVAISLTFTRSNKTETNNVVAISGARPLLEDAIGHFEVSDTSGKTVP
ncbi:MAG: hypothetical protein ABJC26_04195, partial [Gemmatimonadaceae bacterium]